MHGEWVMFREATMYNVVAILSMADVCGNCGVHEQCWVCMVCMVYVKKIFAAECGRYGSMEDCGVSNIEYLVHLVRMNRLRACREFCGVYTV